MKLSEAIGEKVTTANKCESWEAVVRLHDLNELIGMLQNEELSSEDEKTDEGEVNQK